MARIYINTDGVEAGKSSLRHVGVNTLEVYSEIRTIMSQMDMEVSSKSAILSRLSSLEKQVNKQASSINTKIGYLTKAQDSFRAADKKLSNKGKETVSWIDRIKAFFKNSSNKINSIMSLFAAGLAQRLSNLVLLFRIVSNPVAIFGVISLGYLYDIFSKRKSPRDVASAGSAVVSAAEAAKKAAEDVMKAAKLDEWIKEKNLNKRTANELKQWLDDYELLPVNLKEKLAKDVERARKRYNYLTTYDNSAIFDKGKGDKLAGFNANGIQCPIYVQKRVADRLGIPTSQFTGGNGNTLASNNAGKTFTSDSGEKYKAVSVDLKDVKPPAIISYNCPGSKSDAKKYGHTIFIEGIIIKNGKKTIVYSDGNAGSPGTYKTMSEDVFPYCGSKGYGTFASAINLEPQY